MQQNNQFTNIELDWNDSEIEEIFNLLESESTKPYIKKKKREKASVTDLSKIQWCEIQHQFEQTFGKPPIKPVMLAGTKRHDELEKEIYDLVDIKVNSYLDSWGCKLLDAITRVSSILVKGKGREILVFSFLKEKNTEKEVFITGIIDLIEKKNINNLNQLIITDNKTRQNPTLPLKVQSNSQQYQVMLYKVLLDKMIGFGRDLNTNLSENFNNIFNYDQFFKILNINKEEKFSNEFMEELHRFKIPQRLGRKRGNKEDITIQQLLTLTLKTYGDLPKTSNELVLNYEQQNTKLFIGDVNFQFDLFKFSSITQLTLEYYLNLRQPIGVTDIEEANLKCGNCFFSNQCDWRESMAKSIAFKKS